MCGELTLSVSHDYSLSRLFPRSISALLIVLYSSGVGVETKGNHSHRKASLSTIAMQVDAVLTFA